ncbi:MAG: hypothetical protein ACKO9H_08430 [Planctomycetota bacterium]
MLFRGWYHACQLGLFGFAITFFGFAVPAFQSLITVGVWIITPLGLTGAILGLLLVTRGIRSACPLCGKAASWTSPAKKVLAIDCHNCGLVGGNPVRDRRPRELHEYDEEDASNPEKDSESSSAKG